MSERGMKKYLPYASLIEQGDYLKKMVYQKNRIERPLVSIDDAKRINAILVNFNQNKSYLFTLYIDGYLYKIENKISKIDIHEQALYLEDFAISLKDVIDIEDDFNFDEIC